MIRFILILAVVMAWIRPQAQTGQQVVRYYSTLTNLLESIPARSQYVALIQGVASSTNADGYALFYSPSATNTADWSTIFTPTNGVGRWFKLAGMSGGISSITGDLTAAGIGSVAGTLASTGVTNGVYGSATTIPVFSVDAKGRITGVTNVAGTFGTGTVTSVSMTVPTGFSISGSPVTGSGTLALTMTGGINATNLSSGSVSNTEFDFLDGVTSAIQSQLNAKTGTVTSVSLAVPDGLGVSGSPVTGAGTITITTALTNLVKGTGSGFSNAVAGVDYQAPGNYVTALTGDVTASGPGSTTATLANTTISAGTYGSATQVAQIGFDSKGRATNAVNVTISGVAPGGSASGDLSGSFPSPTVAKINGATLGDTTATAGNLLIGTNSTWVSTALSGDATLASSGAITLANSGVTNGSYGSATTVPTFAVDAKGRITAATNVTISGVSPGGSAGGSLVGTYPNPTLAGGVTAGTYRSVTVQTNGLVSAGTNPTTFSGYGISDTSANLAAALTDETGTGVAVFGTSPTLSTSLTITNGTVGTVPLTVQHAAGATTNILSASVGGTNRFNVTVDGNVVIGGSQSAVSAGGGVILKRSNSSIASNKAGLVITQGDGSEGNTELAVKYLAVQNNTVNGVDKNNIFGLLTGNATNATLYIGGSGALIGFGSGSIQTSVSDVLLGRESSGVLQLGIDAATVDSPQVVKAADGSGTDKAGAALQLRGGQSTGTGRGGDLAMATSLTSTTGSTANSYSTRSYQSAKPVDLTESTATLFANVSLATNAIAGFMLQCTVYANDGTDYQALHSTVNVAGVNKAGTVTPTLTQVDGTTAASSGTLTCTYTAVANGNGIDIKANAVSSLTQTVLRVKWMITAMNSDGVATVTAQ